MEKKYKLVSLSLLCLLGLDAGELLGAQGVSGASNVKSSRLPGPNAFSGGPNQKGPADASPRNVLPKPSSGSSLENRVAFLEAEIAALQGKFAAIENQVNHRGSSQQKLPNGTPLGGIHAADQQQDAGKSAHNPGGHAAHSRGSTMNSNRQGAQGDRRGPGGHPGPSRRTLSPLGANPGGLRFVSTPNLPHGGPANRGQQGSLLSG
ncbi:MAG: hypothetical protein LBJ81_01745, partial [Puniceicoccales bacterium]|nr:hypothetical protein [Puniceicoccales bacterium]